ncbi:uncharacterized protein LOC126724213 [Quercus robur]|uniref:uncharacterized protein LOC126724213 n=1 Tax=Quercus robur TaxID=38942 RepID=UPI0021623CE5|nr:uncharacterized protein LOC126724213 [Quercus robur]
MRILSWNCRGLGKSSAIRQCQKIAHKSRLDILFLMETRLVKDRGKLIWEKCGLSEGWEFPRTGLSGGLLLAWMPKQCLIIKYESKHLVHVDLVDNRGTMRSIKSITVLSIGYLGRKLWSKGFKGNGASSSRFLVSSIEERKELHLLMRLGTGRVQWCSTDAAAVPLTQSQLLCLKVLEKQL